MKLMVLDGNSLVNRAFFGIDSGRVGNGYDRQYSARGRCGAQCDRLPRLMRQAGKIQKPAADSRGGCRCYAVSLRVRGIGEAAGDIGERRKKICSARVVNKRAVTGRFPAGGDRSGFRIDKNAAGFRFAPIAADGEGVFYEQCG